MKSVRVHDMINSRKKRSKVMNDGDSVDVLTVD